jgi:glutamyl-tRNA reductase
MHLVLLGASHHSAPVDLRERVDFSRRGVPEALSVLGEIHGITEVVVLSTCNRSEIYAMCEDSSQQRDALTSFMSSYHDVPESELAPHLYGRHDADAVRHLFRVAAGLDALVVGEPQILGQVKDAFSTALQRGYTGALLNRLFQWSFGVGKRVRSETGLGEGAVSVSFAAISLAKKIFGDLTGARALLIGAGEMAELTATHLRTHGIGQISVASRTAAHAAALAASVQGEAVPWANITTQLTSADIVVTATGSSEPIVTRAHVDAAMRPRRDRPLFIMDIGLPRDVDPSSGEIEQVFLYNIDDLQAIVRENLTRRQSQVDLAESMVDDDVEQFMVWLRSRAAIPTLVALRKRFETIRQSELERLKPKLAALPPASQARIDEITRLLVEKLLSAPTEQLKATTDQERVAAYADALNRLFKLQDDPNGPRVDPRSPASRSKVPTSRDR